MNTAQNISSSARSDRAHDLHVNPAGRSGVDIVTRGDGVIVSDDLQKRVVRKIGRAQLCAPRTLRIKVQFQKERAKPSADQYRVTVHYKVPGRDVFATDHGRDPVAALDAVSGKIRRRLRKRKTATLAKRMLFKKRTPSSSSQ